MKNILLVAFLFLPSLVYANSSLEKSEFVYDTSGEIRDDFRNATNQGKILVYSFEQIGCAYCLYMHEKVYTDPIVSKLMEKKFYFVQVDMRSSQAIYQYKEGLNYSRSSLAKTLGAFGSPTYVFFKSDSDFNDIHNLVDSVAFKLDGALHKDIFIKILTERMGD